MNRLPGLGLLRAVAIIWVMLFHSYIVGGLGARFDPIGGYGWMGVDLFFVLSGYLIGWQLLKPLSRGEPLRFGNFYLRRAFRILPVFGVVLALYAGFPMLREAPGLAPTWQFATFTLNLLIDYPHNHAFSHAWSLCVEEHFYLVFPWLAWWLARRPSWRRCVSVCTGVVLAGMAIRGYVWLHDMAPLRGIDPQGFGTRFVEGIYYPTYTRLDGLLAGVALASIRAYRPVWWLRLQANAQPLLLAGLCVVGAAMVLFNDRLGFAATVLGYPLLSLGLMLLVAAGTSRQGWLGRWQVPGADWIARISYSLYLSHKIAFHLVERGLSAWPPIPGYAAFVLYALATLAGAALLYYAVELPFLRMRERLSVSRPHAVYETSPISPVAVD